MPEEHITRDALNRIEENSRREVSALDRLLTLRLDQAALLSRERLGEIQRRLEDLNNSSKIAADEKRRTDDAALRVQEQSVTKHEFQAWKDEVNRALNLAQGAATARAAMLSIGVGFAVLVLNVIIRYLTPR